MTKKIFESFVDKVLDFPFWVKEVLYIKLREDFEAQSVSESDLHTPLEESYQLYTPLITLIGQAELEQRGKAKTKWFTGFCKVLRKVVLLLKLQSRIFGHLPIRQG